MWRGKRENKIRMFQKLRKREEFATNIKIRKPELFWTKNPKISRDRHWWVKSNGKQKKAIQHFQHRYSLLSLVKNHCLALKKLKRRWNNFPVIKIFGRKARLGGENRIGKKKKGKKWLKWSWVRDCDNSNGIIPIILYHSLTLSLSLVLSVFSSLGYNINFAFDFCIHQLT